MKFVLKPDNRNSSDEDLINDLKKVAKELSKDYVLIKEYDKYWRYSAWTLKKRFWGWINSLEKAWLKHIKNYNITEEELLKEMSRIVTYLNKNSITKEEFNKNTKITNSTKIERTFWSWNNA